LALHAPKMEGMSDAPDTTPIGYEEAQALTGVSESTLRWWVHMGRIPHLRLGPRTVRFERPVLLEWMAQRRKGGEAPAKPARSDGGPSGSAEGEGAR
jgi:excisionase family DNA binding protein